MLLEYHRRHRNPMSCYRHTHCCSMRPDSGQKSLQKKVQAPLSNFIIRYGVYTSMYSCTGDASRCGPARSTAVCTHSNHCMDQPQVGRSSSLAAGRSVHCARTGIWHGRSSPHALHCWLACIWPLYKLIRYAAACIPDK